MNRLRYSTFGKTGCRVSLLGFGAMNLPDVPFEQAAAALNCALDLGVNYIDTAAAYRNSEEIIGAAISHRRDEFFLATKTAKRDYRSAKTEIEQSLRRLKTDHIDLLQIHYVNRPEEFRQATSEGGAYQAALEMKEKGYVRFIGITGHRPELLARWAETGLFDQVLFHLSLVQPFAGRDLLPTLVRLNLGRVAMKPLSGGFVKPAELALWYAAAQDVHVVISGMKSVEEVEFNVKAVERPVDESERRELDALAEELGAHGCRRCNYCSCPVGIKIPDIMISSISRERLGLLPNGIGFYRQQSDKIAMCETHEPCRTAPLCEPLCPYRLPIRQIVRASAGFVSVG